MEKPRLLLVISLFLTALFAFGVIVIGGIGELSIIFLIFTLIYAIFGALVLNKKDSVKYFLFILLPIVFLGVGFIGQLLFGYAYVDNNISFMKSLLSFDLEALFLLFFLLVPIFSGISFFLTVICYIDKKIDKR